MADRIQDLGVFTAYGEAREAGYEGTKAEFELGLKKSAEYAENAQASADDAELSAAGAAESAEDAETSAGEATQSATDAAASAVAAAGSANAASASATQAASNAQAALGDIAPVFDATKAYNVGDYVIYTDGKLYRFTVAHAAGAWVGTDAMAVVIGQDVSELKSAITNGRLSVELDLSTYPNTRFNSRKIQKTEGIYPLSFECTNQDYSFYIAYYKTDNTLINNTGWQKGEYTITADSYPDEGTYCVMICKADDEHALSDAEKAYFSAYSVPQIYKDVETLKQKEQIFYVATSGNDGNDGSKASPFKTITKALNSNARYIFVSPGTYSERLTLTGIKNLSIAAYYDAFSTSDYSAKIVLDGINTRPLLMGLTDCINVTLTNIKVINFTAKGIKCTNCSGLVFNGCEACDQYGSYEYGIGFELIKSDAVFNDCVAHDVTLDGFNFHDYGEYILNNCVAYNCGDDGVSHHDACTGHIIGGEWYNCGKGGVSSPTHGAYVDISGVYTHDNLYGIYTSNTSGIRNCKARINNCVAKNNTNYDILISGTDAIGWQNIYSTKSVASGASFNELD